MDFNGAFQPAGETTGRSLVLFEEGGAEAGMQAMQDAIGVQVVAAATARSRPPRRAAASSSSRSASPSSTRRPTS